jgi:very-short-patch-repair endonuclease
MGCPIRFPSRPILAKWSLTGGVGGGRPSSQGCGVARRPHVPAELKAGPFTVEEARQAGLTRANLRSSGWRRVSHGIYTRAGNERNAQTLLAAAACRLPGDAVFSGKTAGWLHGLDLTPADPVEATLPPHSRVCTRAGLRIRQADLAQDEIRTVRGWPATTIERSLLDLACQLSFVETVVVTDQALHLEMTDLAELERFATVKKGRAGIAQFRKVLAVAEPAAESPMETRLRMLIVSGGLPAPQVQVTIRSDVGDHIARADLYYRDARLVIEYDGETHRESLAEDDRRQNRLIGAGHRLLRYTAADVYNRPDRICAEVHAALNNRFLKIGPLNRETSGRFSRNGRP